MKDLNFLSCVMCPLSQPVYLTVKNNDLTVNTFWDNLKQDINGVEVKGIQEVCVNI